MMKKLNWVEREFDFNLPVGFFPCIIERLRGTPARLEEIAATHAPDILITRVGDAWSMQEHVGHLLDLDELHEGRLEDYDAGVQVLRAADMSNRRTHEARHNETSMLELLAGFRAARHSFVRRLDAMDEVAAARTALHPRLQKRMRVIDLAIFVAEHDDHHLATMSALSRTLSAR